MKEVSRMVSGVCKPYSGDRKLVHFVVDGCVKKLPIAKMDNEMACSRCKGTDGHVCLNDPEVSPEYCWFCSNPKCIEISTKAQKINSRSVEQKTSYRAMMVAPPLVMRGYKQD